MEQRQHPIWKGETQPFVSFQTSLAIAGNWFTKPAGIEQETNAEGRVGTDHDAPAIMIRPLNATAWRHA
jgi:hypothetical protein